MIQCNVRSLTNYRNANATPPGLACLWSGLNPSKLNDEFYISFGKDKFNQPFRWLDNKNMPLDLVFSHFKNPKIYEKVIGDSPYTGEQYWKLYKSLEDLGVRRVSCEELCIFPEAVKDDYDLFWIHTSIVKTAVMMPGPYEMGRHPAIVPYDTIRKDKEWKRRVFRTGVIRYKQVLRYFEEMRPDEIIIVSSDHGTMTDTPFTTNQIDEIPLIVNRNVDLSNTHFQWDVKNLILKMREHE